MQTSAYLTFQVALGDAKQLMEIYDEELAASIPTVPERIEVLKRAALILGVTAWETYLEDLLNETFGPLLRTTESPTALPSAFDQVAKRWLKNPESLSATGLTSWTGDRWREHFQNFFDGEIRAHNTPNSKNARKLFRTFLNIDLATIWKWRGYNFEAACKRLDEMVTKRGAITHVARRRSSSLPTKHALSRHQVNSYLQFLEEIAATTDGKV